MTNERLEQLKTATWTGAERDEVMAYIEECEAALEGAERLRARRVDKLEAELSACRAELAALIGALPKCGDCDATATRTCYNELFYCDNPAHGWDTLTEVSWAPILRRLDSRKGTG